MTEEKQDPIKELGNVNPEIYFRVANGTILNNIK